MWSALPVGGRVSSTDVKSNRIAVNRIAEIMHKYDTKLQKSSYPEYSPIPNCFFFLCEIPRY
jgi:hypothetical protein